MHLLFMRADADNSCRLRAGADNNYCLPAGARGDAVNSNGQQEGLVEE